MLCFENFISEYHPFPEVFTNTLIVLYGWVKFLEVLRVVLMRLGVFTKLFAFAINAKYVL